MSDEDEKDMDLVIMPGAFDGLTEEEAKAVYEDMQRMIKDGTLFENSEPVDMEELQREEPELYESLINADIPPTMH